MYQEQRGEKDDSSLSGLSLYCYDINGEAVDVLDQVLRIVFLSADSDTCTYSGQTPGSFLTAVRLKSEKPQDYTRKETEFLVQWSTA